MSCSAQKILAAGRTGSWKNTPYVDTWMKEGTPVICTDLFLMEPVDLVGYSSDRTPAARKRPRSSLRRTAKAAFISPSAPTPALTARTFVCRASWRPCSPSTPAARSLTRCIRATTPTRRPSLSPRRADRRRLHREAGPLSDVRPDPRQCRRSCVQAVQVHRRAVRGWLLISNLLPKGNPKPFITRLDRRFHKEKFICLSKFCMLVIRRSTCRPPC